MSDRQDHKVFPLLEKPCDKCRGRGWYSFGGGEKDRCPICDGAGYEPTEFGESILALIRHNLKSMFQCNRNE